jgi:acetyl-CoA synthetase
MFEGVPTYPDSGRFWQVVEKHNVSLFYTAPTAIRALMREGERASQKMG